MKMFFGLIVGFLLYNAANSENSTTIAKKSRDFVLQIRESNEKTGYVLLGRNEYVFSLEQLFKNFPVLLATKNYNYEGNFKELVRLAAIYNRNNKQNTNFQPVEIWIGLEEGEITYNMPFIYSVNRIHPFTVTTVLISVFQNNRLNNTDFQSLKSIADTENLRLGVYSYSSTDTCLILKALPLQYIELVYIEYSMKLEFESCKGEIEKHLKGSNTKLGFISKENVLVLGKDHTEVYYPEKAYENWEEYFPTMSDLFQTPLMIDGFLGVQNNTEYGNNCYNANDVLDWVQNKKLLRNKLAGSMVPFDLITFNITTEILATLLLATPRLVVANFHSLDELSVSRMDVFFKTLQLAIEKTHGTDFAENINITMLLIEYEKKALDETYINVLWKIGRSAVVWETVLSNVINEIALVASSSRGWDRLHQILRNSTMKKWDPRLGIFVDARECFNERRVQADFIVLKYVMEIAEYCKKLDWYMTKLTATIAECEIYMRDMSRLKIERRVMLQTTGCRPANNNIYTIREYGVVLQAWHHFARNKPQTFHWEWPVGIDFAAEMDTEYKDYDTCAYWTISKEKDDSNSFILETPQQVAQKLLVNAFPELYLKAPETNGEKPITNSTELNHNLWWLAVPCVLLMFVFGFLSAAAILTCFLKRHFQNVDMSAFFMGKDQLSNDQAEGMGLAESIEYQKDKFEKPSSSFKIDQTCCLGSGEYGIIFKGILIQADGDKSVAVKTVLKTSRVLNAKHLTRVKSLMAEIKILAYVGGHNHVVQLCGANTSQLKRGRLYVFLEYCENGSLVKYLRQIKAKENFSQESCETLEENTNENKDSSSCLDPDVSLLFGKWCHSIADGMEYLATKKILHADLAARNILLDKDYTAKISDFGLSRRLYGCTNYVKLNNQEPLPWRWMAPEALKRMEFNEKTDVWAFGVLLWEMYTMGDTPYSGLSWSAGFAKQLEDGLRLEAPKYGNEREIYAVMLKCWASNQEIRPCFSEIVEIFSR